MEDIDAIACLHPTGMEGFVSADFAINLPENKQRFVPEKRKHPPLVVAQPLASYSHEDREATQDAETQNSLDYTVSLRISLSQIPKTSLGLVAGWDPRADIVLPHLPGISFHHFSLTFDDAYRFIVRDLGSRTGTCVVYGKQDEGPRSDFQWIIGGDENLKGLDPIIIRVILKLQFQIVVSDYDINSEAFRAKVDTFRAGTADLDDTLGDLGIREPTRLPTGINTPPKTKVLVQRKIGEGGFAVVHHVWNASTGDTYALKMPLGKVQKYHVKAWKNEARLMGRVSHVSLDAISLVVLVLYSDVPSRTTL
ncbi:hypothetical protein ONZ43_g6558 [Nemania bipapillata]|uniref:Uncharacterized protein n=1 Tax=Nemania bipapillata TaxID=110536 RepID=A0ACC2HYG0_9PEZI|nr:hypothetical protein ONZ43_g6558 [Nemania bipapillata]